MRKLLFLISFFFSYTAQAQYRLCMTDYDMCAIFMTNEQNYDEIWIDAKMASLLPVQTKSDFQKNHLIIRTMDQGKYSQLMQTIVADEKTTTELSQKEVDQLEDDFFESFYGCAGTGIACMAGGAKAFRQGKFFTAIFGCVLAGLQCRFTVKKYMRWQEVRDKFEKQKEKKMQDSILYDPTDLPPPDSGMQEGGGGWFVPTFGGGHEPKLPEGKVISADCPDGGC